MFGNWSGKMTENCSDNTLKRSDKTSLKLLTKKRKLHVIQTGKKRDNKHRNMRKYTKCDISVSQTVCRRGSTACSDCLIKASMKPGK